MLRLLVIELTDRLTVIFANRLKKVEFMYGLAAATYGTLSERISSFATIEWNLDAYEKYLGHDGSAEGFAKAVKELSVAYTNFCELCSLLWKSTDNYIGEHELLPEEDGIFNFFVTEPGGKVGRT